VVRPVLHEAAFTGRVEVVHGLTELGADKSITNDDGKTPAEVAESDGHKRSPPYLGSNSEASSSYDRPSFKDRRS
jgi:ankyrin repeat protein